MIRVGKSKGSAFNSNANPEADGYKFLTQGAMGLADLRISSTILTNGNSAEIVEKALEMLNAMRKTNTT